MSLSKKAMDTEDRLVEMYEEAVARFLDKMDFQMWDWMSKEELEEYKKLQKEVGEDWPEIVK
jgi:hypothetical protein